MTEARLGQTRDPVCGEVVAEDAHCWTHRHIKYAFCSSHCRGRFQRWPHLYLGEATFGLAEAQRGTTVPKHRRIMLAAAPGSRQAQDIVDAIGALKGVSAVEVSGDEVQVDYDLMQACLRDIEAATRCAGAKLRTRLRDRLAAAVIHYNEECELDNLSHLASHYRP